jgi:hypothetical protein
MLQMGVIAPVSDQWRVIGVSEGVCMTHLSVASQQEQDP